MSHCCACPGIFVFSAHSAGAVLHQIGGFQISDVQLDGKGILVVGFRDGKAAAPGRIVKAAHVPADGNGFLDVQLHEPLDEEHALFAVAVGEQILHAVAGHLFPLAGGIVLYIAGALFVVVGLAQIVQQSTDGIALLTLALGEKAVVEGIFFLSQQKLLSVTDYRTSDL